MRSIAGIGVVISAVLAMASSTFAADCHPVVEEMSVYEQQVSRALHDEPEDLPKELRRFEKALSSGDTAQADRVQGNIVRAHEALLMTKVPSVFNAMHADMIEYYAAGVAVLDAVARGDEDARRAAEIETWIGLRKYFTNIRDLFVEHHCNEGDVEAIEAHYLPMVDQELDALRSAEAAPDIAR